MHRQRRRPANSERATLKPFEALSGNVPPRDQRDLMERPFFSLAKAKRVSPILYQAGDTQVQVYAVAEHGMATIWDADVLIWAASQILAAQDRGLQTSRFFRFTPYQLLIAIARATGNREYQLLKGALTRLQSTVIRTTIRQGEHWRRQQFSWISEWEELTTQSGRCEGMEFVLPEWFYQGVVDRRLVLAIDPTYFTLSGGIERWLYRVARKHAGRQPAGWRFELRHLHGKSASLARFSDFALDVRRIVARQSLPGYTLALERHEGRCEVIAMRPSTGSGDKRLRSPADIGTSGAKPIGISGAPLSGLRAHKSSPSQLPDNEFGALKDSKPESKSSFCCESDPPWKTAHRRCACSGRQAMIGAIFDQKGNICSANRTPCLVDGSPYSGQPTVLIGAKTRAWVVDRYDQSAADDIRHATIRSTMCRGAAASGRSFAGLTARSLTHPPGYCSALDRTAFALLCGIVADGKRLTWRSPHTLLPATGSGAMHGDGYE